MNGFSITILAVACLLSGGMFCPSGTALQAAEFSELAQPFFERYCTKCHGPEKSKGKLTLHDIKGNIAAGDDHERWELILDVLEGKEMPPEEEENQPARAERSTISSWIKTELRAFVTQTDAPAHQSTTRRLTNLEYENTMRDLLGFQLKLIDNLPKDPVKPYQFNNTSEFMRMGPEQIDRYLENARRAMASAIVDPTEPEIHQTKRTWKPHGLDKGMGADEIGPWGNRRHSPSWGMSLKSFPNTGEFRVRVRASAILPPGINEMPLRLIMGFGINVNSSTQQVEPIGTIRLRNNPDHPETFELRGRIENFPKTPAKMVKGKLRPPGMTITPQNLYDDGTLNDGRRPMAMPRAVIEWMEFEAPIADQWPPEHHTAILFKSPLRQSNPKEYVRSVLEKFVSRAYRRPATPAEVKRFESIYDLVSGELPNMESAMRETLAMVLVSPPFLYHTAPETNESLNDYALASRLSYFLWRSMPDQELLDLAAAGTLNSVSMIERQVKRLLEDDRSRDFVKDFTMQWLSLAKMKTVPINRDLFPRFLYYVPAGERAGTEEPYRPTIRDYMLEETIGFIAELIKRNSPVTSIIDSDFAFLNQPLAAHYGIAGVEGDELRPIALQPDDRIGGLLTQGSMLIGNGTGSAPHPIYRAVWLREAILGDDVKPPPADVPALTDSVGESAEQALTIKDLLKQHRQKESCNDCHASLDPWGIPFEQFNAIGKFEPLVPMEGTRVRGFDKRVHENLEGYKKYLNSLNTVEVQAEARVPRGPTVNGLTELKAFLLKERKNDIANNVLRRLLGYGLGRKLSYRDRFAIESLSQQSQERGNRMQDMIVMICQSDLFRKSEGK